ncbi:hypothetical protein SAMN02745150_00379 [Brevinema andersonii]|uniref:Uncharacterized protein n=1 Tax=Brevinema andersonii TaxID=34097 RepID=A0A1I1D761_BREAD|nr:hypothetical protein [Brevinema andersonii]SFB70781.1 hypothetical protein SAMN02745150_00379 [Brevinema andersonii]
MMWIYILIIFIGVGIYWWRSLSFLAEEHTFLTKKLDLLEPFLNASHLGLEEQTAFIETARQFSMILVEASRKNIKYKKQLQMINHRLLGFILSIPRLDEDPAEDMLLKAVKQIETIDAASKDICRYLNKKKLLLRKYIAANKPKNI